MSFQTEDAERWPKERLYKELEARQRKLDERRHQLQQNRAAQEEELHDLIENGIFDPHKDEIDDLDEPHRSHVRRLLDKEPPASLLGSIARLEAEVRSLKALIAEA